MCPYLFSQFQSGLLYAVGGLTKAGDSLSTVEVMDPVTGRWNPAEAMSIRRSRVGVAILRNNLYGANLTKCYINRVPFLT
jgi:hypothetical protein